MENMHAKRAVDYYGRNFNCSQGVFTTYAIEHMDLNLTDAKRNGLLALLYQ